MSYFEISMLVCFGIAWPFSIYRSYLSKSTKGKSAVFLVIVIVGYASGIIHKVMYSFDGVTWFYIANMFMVAIDTVLYYRNRTIEKR